MTQKTLTDKAHAGSLGKFTCAKNEANLNEENIEDTLVMYICALLAQVN